MTDPRAIEALARKLCEEDGFDPDEPCEIYNDGHRWLATYPLWCKWAEEAEHIIDDENRLTSPPE